MTFSPAPAYFASDFCEGNSWQYSFFVPQDPEGLIRQMGGRRAFVERLDSLFTATAPGAQQRSFGHIGQYAHENEPVHHILYLYNYAGASEDPATREPGAPRGLSPHTRRSLRQR